MSFTNGGEVIGDHAQCNARLFAEVDFVAAVSEVCYPASVEGGAVSSFSGDLKDEGSKDVYLFVIGVAHLQSA